LYPHRFFAQQEKNLHEVPSRESNSGLPYSKPTRYQLSHAARVTQLFAKNSGILYFTFFLFFSVPF
jgi:hypothetical protein